jgi:hypothetical protein
VRPPDENQNDSTRPNFMSSARRAAGADDNILARLERDAKRSKSGKSWKYARIAWSTLASVLVIGLIITLVSLARENLTVHRQPVLIEAKAAPPEPLGAAASAAMVAKGGFAPLPIPAMKLAAAVIDVPPEPAQLTPMVMLKPAAEAPARPVAPTLAARSPAPKPAAKNAPAKPAQSAKPAPARAVAAAPTRTVAAAAPRAVAVVAPPRPVPTAAPARSIAAAPARAKKAAPATAVLAPEPAAVDSDVALLSAIIMHASRHAGERAQLEAARCGAGKKCAPQNDPATSPKATD